MTKKFRPHADRAQPDTGAPGQRPCSNGGSGPTTHLSASRVVLLGFLAGAGGAALGAASASLAFGAEGILAGSILGSAALSTMPLRTILRSPPAARQRNP